MAAYGLSFRPREKLGHILLEIFILKFPAAPAYLNKGVQMMAKTFQVARILVVFVTMCFAIYGLLTDGANATFALKVAAILAIVLGTHLLGEVAHAASDSEKKTLDLASDRRMIADQNRVVPLPHSAELDGLPVQVAS